MLLISWVWSFIAGTLAVAFLLMEYGGLAAIGLAIIGIIRRRCPWWGPFLYAAIAVVSALLFRSVFWMSERLAQDDVISTALFWSATLLGLLGSFREGKRLMREV
jgi:hypothetical protein